jgi:hypothetical protein
MCISTVHPRPNTPLITSYLLPLTSKRSADRLSDTPSRHIPTRSFWLFTSFGRAGRCRSRGMRLDTAHAVRTHLGSCPAASILPRNTLERSPHCDRAAGLPRYTSPTPHLHYPIRRRAWRARREARAGRGRCWGYSRALRGGDGRVVPGSSPAVLGVGTAHIRMRLKLCRSNAILARSVGPWRCSMRAYAFRITALHSGMRVVCARVGEKITTPPPT